jgi:hypothetical protein
MSKEKKFAQIEQGLNRDHGCRGICDTVFNQALIRSFFVGLCV